MKLPKTTEQFALALIWSGAVIVWISYILMHYGQDKGILNLLIGFMTGGVAGGIFGVYFMSSISKKTEPPPPGTITQETTTTTATILPTDKKENQ